MRRLPRVETDFTSSNPTVWINDAWCASELFEKKAQIYASRPRMVVFGELGTGQGNLVTMRIRNQQERDHWRIHRKLMHLGVGMQAVRGYREIQNNESKVVAYDFLREPGEYVKHLERYATSIVSIIAFGRRVASYNDPIITEVIAIMQLAADLNVPGKKFPMLLETFPCKCSYLGSKHCVRADKAHQFWPGSPGSCPGSRDSALAATRAGTTSTTRSPWKRPNSMRKSLPRSKPRCLPPTS